MQKQRYTLSDVYNAARRERHFNYVFWLHVTLDILGTYAMHGAGFCLVIFATILITMISALGFLVVLPANFEAGSFWMACHSIWGKRFCATVMYLFRAQRAQYFPFVRLF